MPVMLLSCRRHSWGGKEDVHYEKDNVGGCGGDDVLVFALPALAQEATQDSCDWYWDYNYVKSGGWEYWCWNPTLGWWYSTDGKAKTTSVTVQG